MNNNAKPKKSNFAWVVMAGLGLMGAGSSGSYTVLVGSFLTPISKDLNINISTLSYYFTVLILALALTLPFVGKILPKVNLPVTLTAIAAVEVVLGGLMSQFTEAWMFLAGAAVIGVCMAFTSVVPMSIIMDNWFKKKTNFAIGICWSFTSVYLAIMSPVLSQTIESYGWRNSFIILAVVSAVLIIPSTLFIIRYQPSDKGMLAYGEEEVNEDKQEETVSVTEIEADPRDNLTFKQTLMSPAFFIVVATLCVVQLTVVMNQLFPTYAETNGFGPTVGGLMVSSAMIFDMFLNPIVGATCDRFGAIKALLGWVAISIISFGILILSTNLGLPLLAIFGAGINDVMYVVCGTGITALAIHVFGSKQFGSAFSYVMAFGYIVGSFGMPLMTSIYTQYNSFIAVFVFCIILNVVVAMLVLLAAKSTSLLKHKATKLEKQA
ncbi:MFS transporter [Lactobacillus sp. YT155]|uniref:MFS transporter n=1 Tax=Lactobacillus sp. YT155 TaxID=3060955 RepID=UPI0026603841|nr:MFS transporter [Lactobacillus sp. YT155]MDO1604706.1 MFS transporter [Lactobacillus sp. YT155]